MKKIVALAIILMTAFFLHGCGGDGGGAASVATGSMIAENPISAAAVSDIAKMMENSGIVMDGDEDKFYERLESAINEKLGAQAGAPPRGAGIPVLSKVTPGMAAYEIQLAPAEKTTFDLGVIRVSATYAGAGTPVNDVTESPELKWSIYSGNGSLSNKIFTPAAAAGTTVFIVRYTENGLTRYALFRLKIIALSQITLSPASDRAPGSSVEASIFDLSKIAVIAVYSNGARKVVTNGAEINWSLIYGGGRLDGNAYTAPQAAETASFKATYAEAGGVRSATFRLIVTKPVLPKPPAKLAIVTQPPDPATVGSVFSRQPAVKLLDASNNEVRRAGIAVTAARKIGTGALLGTLTVSTDTDGVAVFGGLFYDQAEDMSIVFSSPGLAAVESAQILVESAASDFIYGGVPVTIKGYAGAGGQVVIPAGINAEVIGVNAFKNINTITKLRMPSSVTSIRSGAFSFCGGIKSVRIGSGLTKIESNAFYHCDAMTAITVDGANQYFSHDAAGALYDKNKKAIVRCPEGKTGTFTIPASVTNIEKYAFFNCAGIKSIGIGSGVVNIGFGAFALCVGLTGITIPASVTNIEGHAFENCHALASATIGNRVAGIGECAFQSCRKLKAITIPASVTNIGPAVFFLCDSLTAIAVNGANPNYSSDANGFLYDKSKTTLIQCPNGKSGALAVPNGVTAIGSSAFNSCRLMTGITIPASVTSIGGGAFASCQNLAWIHFDGFTPATVGQYAFQYCPANLIILIHLANVSGWQTRPIWNVFATVAF